jgi:hypothetical protein
VFTVLEGFTLPHDVRKILEAAYYTTPPAAQPEQVDCPECKAAVLYECVACSSNNYPPKPEQEPVACVIDGDLYFHHEIDWEDLAYQGHEVELLYTTPPAAQPTTEDSSAVAAPVQSGLDADCIASVVSQRYTTPPAAQPEQVDCPRCGHVCSQREWVGLTDDQIDEIAVIARRGNLHDLRIAIEAKLKERNNG